MNTLSAAVSLLLVAGPAPALGWTTVASPSEVPGDNYLYGADASGASNVWAVGGVYLPTGGTSHSLALRYDGTAWRSIARTGLPGNDTLRGVDAVADGDVWAVGEYRSGVIRYDTLVAHWNGSAWTREATPNGNPGGMNNLYGVAAAGGTVWAVGNYIDPNSPANRHKLILRRTGGTWRVSAAPVVAPTYESLAAVDATGPSDAWAVGAATAAFAPLILRWNGATWVSMTVTAPPGTGLTGVDARTPSDVWAVGSTSAAGGAQPYVAHFDGTSWRRVVTPALPGGGQLADVVALSSTSVVAVGRSNGAPLILRWNGTSWTRDATPASSNPFLTGAAAAGPGSIWAIGYRFELNAYANRTLTLLGSA
ncbi:hypothetical protein ACQPZX_40400 [Actinoplanes sp. CA-142083]|uniref:hypothetical protein n=1 Tax=Actinoplanes sp. CA-142083 TaxID=3239903 RepID=UPI003D8B83F4